MIVETPAPERELRPGAITRLAVQKKDPQRVAVFIDGAFAFGVHQDVMLQFELRKGLYLDVQVQQAICSAERARRARIVALDYLSYKPRTVHEVVQKLLHKGFDAAVVEETVARVSDLGYLDDAGYARDYVHRRFQTKGYGPRRLASDLKRRGVPRELIDAALTDLEDDALLAEARRHAAKRWTRLSGQVDPHKRRKKISDFLVRRGYDYDLVHRVIEELESES